MFTSPDVPFDIIVIGGGAAGFFAAINASEKASTEHLRIVIIEKARHPLGKVLISGGRRCNITHACFDPVQLVTYYPRGADALRGAFMRFQPEDTMTWFENHGVPLKVEEDGRVFPQSNSAKSIVDCLLNTAKKAGIQLWTQSTVTAIQNFSREPGKEPLFSLLINSNHPGAEKIQSTSLLARHVLLASGGDRQSLSLSASLGHTVEPPVPSLFSFKINDPRLVDLAGISVTNVNLHLVTNKNIPGRSSQTTIPDQQGAALITHWGLSGPGVLRLSSWGARILHACQYQVGLIINWLYPASSESLLSDLRALKNDPKTSRSIVTGHCPFPQLPLRLWKRLVDAAWIPDSKKWANLSKTDFNRLAGELTAGHYEIQGKGPFKEEFVTCGGVSLNEVNFRNMQSRIVPGFFLAGEVLDIDGLTGGFNLQNAWTTGWLAGQALDPTLA